MLIRRFHLNRLSLFSFSSVTFLIFLRISPFCFVITHVSESIGQGAELIGRSKSIALVSFSGRGLTMTGTVPFTSDKYYEHDLRLLGQLHYKIILNAIKEKGIKIAGIDSLLNQPGYKSLLYPEIDKSILMDTLVSSHEGAKIIPEKEEALSSLQELSSADTFLFVKNTYYFVEEVSLKKEIIKAWKSFTEKGADVSFRAHVKSEATLYSRAGKKLWEYEFKQKSVRKGTVNKKTRPQGIIGFRETYTSVGEEFVLTFIDVAEAQSADLVKLLENKIANGMAD